MPNDDVTSTDAPPAACSPSRAHLVRLGCSTIALVCLLATACSSTPPSAAPTTAPTTTAAATDAGAIPGFETIEAPTDAALDDAARGEAADLQAAVQASIDQHGWDSIEQVRADGFQPMPDDELHWYQAEHLADERIADPDAPEFLMVDGDRVLGMMFLRPSQGDDDPADPPGAPLTSWHRHDWSSPVCLDVSGLAVGVPDGSGACPPDSEAADRSPWMFHVWLDSDDPFSPEMHASGHDH